MPAPYRSPARICPKCVREILACHLEEDELPARFWGQPIHTDCFYKLKSMEGVQPPRRRGVLVTSPITTSFPEVHHSL